MNKRKIISDYKSGLSVSKTAKKNGTTPWKARVVILEAGIMRDKNTLGVSRLFDVEKAKELARKGWTHTRIAVKFGTSHSMVSYHLRGLPNLRNAPKYAHDEHFFDEPNPVNSYWAGFISADGCVHRAPTWCMSFTLSVKDIDHLRKFKKAVGSDHPIGVGSKTNRHLRIYSKRWKEMLGKNFSIFPLKTGNEQIPDIQDDLVFHFLRGFFDGDGSVEEDGKYFNFSAGSEKFIHWIRELFQSHHSCKKERSLWRLQLSGSVGRRAIELLYRNSLPQTRLERKYTRCLKVLDRDLFRYVA